VSLRPAPPRVQRHTCLLTFAGVQSPYMDSLPPTRRPPLHPRYDAIHRALLTGLLSDLGTKGESHEYLAPRSLRFHIHPGSALFSQNPKWLMAAELVETTRLYARTCAGIQPQWIEHAAAHLVERTYSEPRWDAKTASAIASEKVTLHGLVIVPARTVSYSPINPRQARELFVQHALVLGDWLPPHTQAPFFRYNARLVEEVQLLEAKIRQRNLLADAATRYVFYDARIPQTVTNGPQFETWRRHAENPRAGNPRLLFMDKADLLRADAPPITPENYPDRLADNLTGKGNLHLPLTYTFQPGDANDGLTLTIPVAALAQLRPERYEWLVPGMLEEKIAAMLRELPGALRRNFVPVPTWAKSAAEALQKEFPHNTAPPPATKLSPEEIENRKSKIENPPSLRDALAAYLARTTGIEISAADFPDSVLPPFLRMAFKILGDDGRVLALSRDLPQLQHQLASHAADSFGTLYNRQFRRDAITSWDFPDLPGSLTVQRFAMSILAFPALIDHTDTCALRLLPTKDAADTAHRLGVRRLFRLEYRRDVKSLATHLPDFPKMALQHFTLGQSKQLREDLVTLVVDRALFSDQPVPRTRTAWDELKHLAAQRLFQTGDAVAALAAKILENYHYLTLALDQIRQAATTGLHAISRAQSAYTDVKDQLLFLMPHPPAQHFLLDTPFAQLEHLPRYLAAARRRLEKLERSPDPVQAAQRDRDSLDLVAPFWGQYLHRKSQHDAIGLRDAELQTFRWMIEEFRVHLFAQELGTALPVSPRRLEKQFAKTRP
jgi:ATP-dependent helicase HrpA